MRGIGAYVSGMESGPSKYPAPSRRDMLLSLGVRCFNDPWTLAIRCSCGWKRETLLPALGSAELGEREVQSLGNLVRWLRCRGRGKRPLSVIVRYEPTWERLELAAGNP